MKVNQLWLRIFGFVGIIGGLILFAGDMLLYYKSGSDDLLYNMANATDDRIFFSGISALFAAWFYLLGLVPVYVPLSPHLHS